jgi:Ni,Fe-hydrogenase III small subunit
MKVQTLKLFNVSHPLMMTETLSLLGHKYAEALPFSWQFTSDLSEANVLLWDGIITKKNKARMEDILKQVESGKILLLLGESTTLYENSKEVEKLNINEDQCVIASGWSVLPEDLLCAFETCYKKLNHV